MIRFLLAAFVVFCLSAILAGAALAAPNMQPAPPATVRVLEGANLRGGPGTGNPIVGSAPAGAILNVTGCDTGCEWYQLDSGAWIAAFLVEPVAGATRAAPVVTSTTSAGSITVNSVANLRSGPGTTFAVVGRAEPGQSITLKARNDAGDWFQLSSDAWIFGNLISAQPQGLPVAGASAQPGCDPAYPDVCIPSPPPDLDCRQVSFQSFRVLPPDPHNFDGNFDGVGCEPAPQAPAAPSTTSVTTRQSSGNCDPSYPGVCIPSPPPDLDCGQIGYRRFTVVGSDPHRFDGDHDGVGCES